MSAAPTPGQGAGCAAVIGVGGLGFLAIAVVVAQVVMAVVS